MFQYSVLTPHTASDSIASTLLRVTMPPEHIGLKYACYSNNRVNMVRVPMLPLISVQVSILMVTTVLCHMTALLCVVPIL